LRRKVGDAQLLQFIQDRQIAHENIGVFQRVGLRLSCS
jgi:hypothetical protein